MEYLLNLSEISPKPLTVIKSKLEGTSIHGCGILLGYLRVKDLIFCGSTPIVPGRGIYIVFSDKGIEYIGKSGSKSFVERVPAHFGICEKDWFNCIIRRMAKSCHHDISNEELVKSARKAMKYRIFLINNDIDRHTEYTAHLETILIALLKPRLNSMSDYRRQRVLSRVDINHSVGTNMMRLGS